MKMSSEKIPFIDLAAQRRRLGAAVERAILQVVDHGAYIMGPEVYWLESALSNFCGAKHAISCANGTDALALVLMAKGLKVGDAVICPSFTFAATAEIIAWVGATPIFADVFDDTFNLDPASVEAAITTARELGLKPTALISVDLFGQPAGYEAIEQICAREKMFLLSDSAQSFGATYHGRKVGTIGLATATSFFPAKPLGCYGDGGAVFTDDDDLAEIMKSIRVHGQGEDKYENVRIGMNGRLDTIQAAVLIEKLKLFPDEILARERVARRYDSALADVAIIPARTANTQSVWAQYTLRVDAGRRASFRDQLAEAGIPTAIYYPKPLHQQTAYSHYPVAGNRLPVSERIVGEVVSLPMHPYLEEAVQDRIIASVRKALS